MKILVAGATGLIGARLRSALVSRGHEVVGVARRLPPDGGGTAWITLDLGEARAADWQERLHGVDAVVNAVGVLQERHGQSFQRLHVAGPAALFDACVRAGVGRVVQVSALGADEGATTAYHLSKKAADEHLLSLPLEAVVVQPSLVFAGHGTSAQLFVTWASLPLLPVPDAGRQVVQPVHLDDLVEALVVLLERWPPACRGARVPMVGPEPTTVTDYLQALRRGLALPPAKTLSIPRAWMNAAARLGDRLPGSLFDSASWQMLQRGNSAPADTITALLGRAPRAPSCFIEADHADAARSHARLQWLLPLLRWAIAFVWILTAIVSLGVYPVQQSFELLARTGVPAEWRPAMLYAAAALDLVLGILTLRPPRWSRWLWAAQALLIAGYTLIISVRLPEFWLHPYGPLSKNLPMLAGLLILAMLEDRRR